MQMVLLTALGVGGSTVIGAILGFVFKKISHKFSDAVMGFAAGVMLAAAVVGLILPSLEGGTPLSLLVTVAGIFGGAVCISLLDKLVPHLHRMVGADTELHGEGNERVGKILLFVLAIAIHNLPEGIAAGVGAAAESTQALAVAGGIALQNIPEGMVIIAPLLAAGVKEGGIFSAETDGNEIFDIEYLDRETETAKENARKRLFGLFNRRKENEE